MVVSH